MPAGTGVWVVNTSCPPDDLPGRGEVHPPGPDDRPDALQGQEGRVALVDMVDPGLQAQRLQRDHSADPQDDLLADPHVLVAAIQIRGDRPIRRGVLRVIRVQEVEAVAPDQDLADPGPDVAALDGDLQGQGPPVSVHDHAHGHGVEVRGRVPLLLPSVGAQVLVEVPVLIGEADPDQGDAHVAGGLEVVPREDPQAPGEDLDAVGDAELRGEVRSEEAVVPTLGFLPEPGGAVPQVRRQGIGGSLGVVDEGVVRGQLLEPRRAHPAEHADRILFAGRPELRIQVHEEATGGIVPGPPGVMGHLPESLDALGQPRFNEHGTNRLHSTPPSVPQGPETIAQKNQGHKT